MSIHLSMSMNLNMTALELIGEIVSHLEMFAERVLPNRLEFQPEANTVTMRQVISLTCNDHRIWRAISYSLDT